MILVIIDTGTSLFLFPFCMRTKMMLLRIAYFRSIVINYKSTPPPNGTLET